MAPHDSLVGNTVSKELCPNGCSGHSYIPRYDSWYRKHFRLPSSWADGSAIWLYFHGTFRETTLFLNGKNISKHISGYTSFAVRLDNQPGLKHGDEENVLALFIDPNTGKTGWWYEGGGLYRHVRLVRTAPIHVAVEGVSSYSANWTSVEWVCRALSMDNHPQMTPAICSRPQPRAGAQRLHMYWPRRLKRAG
eukprot:COSAG01_NODE_6787_length_3498_cov_6.123272_1_plen_193_part_00